MTIPNQWYYVKNNERCGPVDPAQLKQLADAGEVQRKTLVWRVGMADWVEAEQVRGLFVEPSQPGSPSILPSDQASSPTRQPSPAPAPAAAGFAGSDHETPPLGDPALAIQPEPRIITPVRKKSSGETHPVGMLLNWLHAKVGRSYVDASVQLFTKIGFWAILVYAAVSLIGGLIASIQTGMYWQLGVAVGVCVLIAALQYPAVKMLELLGEWKFEAKVPRPFFDMITILAIVAGVGVLIGLTFWALHLGVYPLIFSSIAAFVVLIHLAAVSLSFPGWDDDAGEKADRSIAEEAYSLFGGLWATVIRTVPVIFGAGIALFCLELLYSMASLRNADDPLAGDPLKFIATALYGAAWIFGLLMLPAVTYRISVALRFFGTVLMNLARFR